MQIYDDGIYVRQGELTSYQEILRGWAQNFEWREHKRPMFAYVGFPGDCGVEHDDYCIFNNGDSGTSFTLMIIMLSVDDDDLNWGALICPERRHRWHKVAL